MSSIASWYRGQQLLRRRRVDDALDWLRFRIDNFPRAGSWISGVFRARYQPLPGLGISGGQRAEGTYSRWRAMSPLVSGAQSALDLGCNAGFFTLNLALEGIPTLGVEASPNRYRTAVYAVRKTGLDNVGIVAMRLTPDNVALLPSVDVVVYLSLWHHLVRFYGLDATTSMLARIWQRAGRVLFFETGENTRDDPRLHLPVMTPDARSWIAAYLERTCEGAEAIHLGMHPAANRRTERHLFAVVKRGRTAEPSAG